MTGSYRLFCLDLFRCEGAGVSAGNKAAALCAASVVCIGLCLIEQDTHAAGAAGIESGNHIAADRIGKALFTNSGNLTQILLAAILPAAIASAMLNGALQSPTATQGISRPSISSVLGSISRASIRVSQATTMSQPVSPSMMTAPSCTSLTEALGQRRVPLAYLRARPW